MEETSKGVIFGLEYKFEVSEAYKFWVVGFNLEIIKKWKVKYYNLQNTILKLERKLLCTLKKKNFVIYENFLEILFSDVK